ncbi:unnamed protein product [Notodromas monacha]|uniref:Uncharacterized protein n=1 Tax=Notodromas monacha TaxID=399045 RepID=A0A7R9C4L2_9CRUS|nr:unnamed protein product [Notodromas monacha]CAG0925624.1 unnamed protein product [Notodromas monacha]
MAAPNNTPSHHVVGNSSNNNGCRKPGAQTDSDFESDASCFDTPKHAPALIRGRKSSFPSTPHKVAIGNGTSDQATPTQAQENKVCSDVAAPPQSPPTISTHVDPLMGAETVLVNGTKPTTPSLK